jgi:ribosomal protein S15P/S13E
MNEQDIKKNISTDVAIATLTADFKNLRKDVNEFHVDMKSTLRRLEDGFLARLVDLEKTRVTKEEFEKVTCDFESRIRVMREFQDNIVGKMSIIATIIGVNNGAFFPCFFQ